MSSALTLIATSLLPAATVIEASNGELPKNSRLITVHIKAHVGNPNDAIILEMNGIREDGTSYHLRLPPRPADGDPIIIRLIADRDIDLQSLETLDISYDIKTQQGTLLPSETLHLKVVTERLPRVDILEATGPEKDEIDPDQWPYDVTIIVPTHADFKEGTSVWLHVEGEKPEGSIDPREFRIEPIWVGKDLYFTIASAIILANRNGTAKIYYTLVDGQSTRFSKEVLLWVGSALELALPEVLEGTTVGPAWTTIDPLKVLELETLTLRVSNPDMLDTDFIEPYLQGTASLPIEPKYGDAGKRSVDFIVDIHFIAANLGRKCTTGYRYTRGSRSKLSDVLQLDVQALPSSAMKLVTVSGVVGGELDPRGSHSVQISRFPFMRPGQAVWIVLVVNKVEYTLRDGVAVSQSEFDAKLINELIPRAYLEALSHDNELQVLVWVSLDGTNEKKSAVAFVVRHYRITRVPEIVTTIRFDTPATRVAVSVDGKKAFVIHSESNRISVIGTDDDSVIRTIPSDRPLALAAHPAGEHLYLSQLRDEEVFILNAESYEHIDQLEIDSPSYDLTFNTNGLLFHSAHHSSIKLFHISGGRLAENHIVPSAMALGPNDTYLYTVDSKSDEILVHNSNNLQTIERIPASASQTIALTRTNAHSPYLYCGGSKLVIVDPATNTVIDNLITPDSVSCIAMHPSKALAYVVSGSMLLVINTNSHEIIQEVWVGRAASMAITPDGSRAYIAEGNWNNVTVVSL